MSSRRSVTTCAILGAYKEFHDRQLPTVKYVIKLILFVKNDMKLKYNGKDPSNSDTYAIVFEQISNILTNASILIVTMERVIRLLKSYFKKYLNLKRYPKCKQSISFENNLKSFLVI